MRTTQATNQRKQAWERKTRWAWNEHEDETIAQDSHFQKVGKSGNKLVPPAINGFVIPHKKQSGHFPDFVLQSRQVVLQTSRMSEFKGVRTLVKSNSLPPICGSRLPFNRVKTCVPSHPIDSQAPQMGRKASSSLGCLAKTSLWRPKEKDKLNSSVNVMQRSLATINITEVDFACVKNETSSMKPLFTTPSRSTCHLGLDKMKPSFNNSVVITERIKDSLGGSETQKLPLSDSAIETGSLHEIAFIEEEESNKEIKEAEELYYTTEMIADWIIRVNMSLFSPIKDELNKTQLLKEEDVDTIKIVYDQD